MSDKEEKKNPIAQAMVAMRNKKLSPEQRSELARNAAVARWGKKKVRKAAKKKSA